MVRADSIIYGRIITLDTDKSVVDAMVVKDGRIVYLGSREIAETMRGAETEILDFGTAAVYPGFMDAHTHGPMAGERLTLQAHLEGLGSMQAYVDAMADYVRAHPEKQVYKGAGWQCYETPNAAMLDAVCPDRPMILRSVDGHMMWLNSAAMREVGVDKAFAARYSPSEVYVDESGEPTGFFCELPTAEILKRFPVTKDEMKEALLAWQDFAFSQGITAVGEAMLDMYPVCADAYAELAREGKWKLRTYAYVFNAAVSKDAPETMGEVLKEQASRYDSEYFRIRGLKIILDGVVEAHTAATLEEYADQSGYYGVLNIEDPERLKTLVESANAAGFPVHTHAIGDRAAKMILDAYQEVETLSCDFDSRNVICHLQLIRPEDVKRCGDYNVIAVVAPTWAPVTHPDFDSTLAYLGAERAWNEYPLKSFEDAGATICFHTDYPVVSVMDMPRAVYAAVKRALPKTHPQGGPASVKNPDEAIGPLRALLAMTANIAYMFGAERELGTLAIGKIANATVYTQDFIHYDSPEEIAGAKLVATIVDGRAVYRADGGKA